MGFGKLSLAGRAWGTGGKGWGLADMDEMWADASGVLDVGTCIKGFAKLPLAERAWGGVGKGWGQAMEEMWADASAGAWPSLLLACKRSRLCKGGGDRSVGCI